ncbi:gamma-glutamylcyclotransferase family protein [Falsiruegeria litorea]|uniref:gamma-glutamylcyclotransferase family protein n=1 Tax=Falsiruegeria litorea TaxID=1280831 RepID=UPI001BFD901F|nr:gamma-glutamylcyclotransferase family protein [Falsiruegeria litorea]MBT8170439.1 gamma-glutamylcyclotransferase [Falsiruegeria litorea]
MTETFTYFAYGSNMLSTRLRARCSSAQLLQTGVAKGYRLEFCKKSTDGSGKATLVECNSIVETPGVLFKINRDELSSLDSAEGKGYGYDRQDAFGIVTSEETKTATTYIASATATACDLIPYDWYLALVLAGAIEHGFAQEYIDRIRDVKHRSDPEPERASRRDAIDALKIAGHENYKILLTKD